jgi:transcriptional regulator with XRE-family HTH domain
MTKGAPISELLEALADLFSPAEIIASATKAHIANQIAEWRISHKMTQQDLADLCEVNQSTISKWENGDFNFTIEKLAEIACTLDMTLKVSLDSAEAQNEISASSDDKVSKISYFPKWRRSENNSVYASDSVVQSDSDTPNICLMEG